MYTYQQLFDFTKNIFLAMGCNDADAKTITDVLVAAELRGIESHGLSKIPDYYNLWKTKRINVKPYISIVHETPSTAVVDGDSGFGMIAGKKSMQIAIEKSKYAGTGWVSVRNSNHYGIAGYYSMMALQHDMIGIAMTNASPLVAPTFSVDRLLGTNPIAVAIPANNQPPFVADFATTPIASGKLTLMHKKGIKAPEGYVHDKEGKPSNDPNILTRGGAIVPLGSDYEHGSHKGYCLGSIVDIFSSVLSGAGFGPWVPPSVAYLPVKENPDVKGTGHFFGAMRIDAFRPASEFKEMMDKWILAFRNSKPAEGHEKVLVPGDPERENEAKRMKEGIPILPVLIEKVNEIAVELGV
ncbi:MAG: Ldh family oxidoreductase, partial [Bacteroidota bacterium]